MSLNQIHILKEHRKLASGTPYFGEREIDIYLCELMAFNDEFSKKDGSNFNKFVKMYSYQVDGFTVWKEGTIPIILYDMASGSERDYCNVCRYKFYDMKGLIMSTQSFDNARGKNFYPAEVREAEDNS